MICSLLLKQFLGLKSSAKIVRWEWAALYVPQITPKRVFNMATVLIHVTVRMFGCFPQPLRAFWGLRLTFSLVVFSWCPSKDCSIRMSVRELSWYYLFLSVLLKMPFFCCCNTEAFLSQDTDPWKSDILNRYKEVFFHRSSKVNVSCPNSVAHEWRLLDI